MGKKKIVSQKGTNLDANLRQRALANLPKKKLSKGILHIQSTFNNNKVYLTDEMGNLVMSMSSGQLGFKGAKKSTSYAASKIAELIGEKASLIGVKEVKIVVKGVGQGRDSAIRSFVARGIEVSEIVDRTPVPHNGPRPRKARRV